MSLVVPSACGNKTLSEGRGEVTHFQLLSGIYLKFPKHTDIQTRIPVISGTYLSAHYTRTGSWGLMLLIYMEVCKNPLTPGILHFFNIMAISSLLFNISSQTTNHYLNSPSPPVAITSSSFSPHC